MKITKKSLEERIKILEAENTALKAQIEQLKKEKAVLEGRLQMLDDAWKNCGNAIGDSIKFVQQSMGWNVK